ncbi:MAG: ATP-binding cassette, subfamily bacterial, partial [Actinomycetota bacterium]|nr:ATP-binding cassette, subfamily bacterial [Actinomycetota bacterium]
MRQLIQERLVLLRLLPPVGGVVIAVLGLAMVGTSLLGAGTALAVGALVGRVELLIKGSGTVQDAVAPLCLVGLLLVLDLVSQSLLMPVRNWVALRVNGVVRRKIRAAVLAPPGIEHLESQEVRDAAALSVGDVYLYNIGAAAEGQLWLMARFLGAVAAASLVASYSPLLAMFTFGCMVTQRAVLRRQYAAPWANRARQIAPDTRGADYWRSVAGSPLGAKEVRVFGFSDWAVDNFERCIQTPVRLAVDV